MAENNWVTGVITLLIGVIAPFIYSRYSRGPPCMDLFSICFVLLIVFLFKVLPSLKL